LTSNIDPHALKVIASLQRPGKPDLLLRVVTVFKSESPKTIASMQEGLAVGDLEAVRNAAHTLKSSSAYVGAKVFSDVCRDLEGAAREKNYTGCVVLAYELDDLFEACCLELDDYLQKAA